MHKRTYLCLLFLLITQNQFLAHAATKTCFCRISHGPQGGPFSNFSSLETGFSINTLIISPANNGDCRNKCTEAFKNNESSIAQQACAAGIPNGNLILGISQLSTSGTQTAASRHLVNIPEKPHVDMICPVGWASNTSNIYSTTANPKAGITLDGQCKKEFQVQGLNIPTPPNGTPIGNWGFYWGNAIVAKGNSANGGAAQSVSGLQLDPPVCKLVP